MSSEDIYRFLVAQNETYPRALAELKAGAKQSHWMWYIFPQLKGLGSSETAQFYGIKDLEEAKTFLAHPVLGENLIEISNVLLDIHGKSAREILGSPDDLEMHSCMTLFSEIKDTDRVFSRVLERFLSGQPDQKTLELLAQHAPGQH